MVNQQLVLEQSSTLTLVPPPSLMLYAKLWLNKLAVGNDYSLQFFDRDNSLVHQRENLSFEQGFADVTGLSGIIPNAFYRLVLRKPFYLPGSVNTRISETRTAVSFPRLLPLDPSNDGKFTFSDIKAFLGRPLEIFKLLFAF